ncbi:hypothetical protein ADUPG1_012308 [Aduncisulcus paluster]|uniref:Uncharacterized protein n=1 Tax=Aduncisulcus paluster TaxID=2918883 RepID=A0ABQ5JZS4_9EUKA|nr:hypothetical protein ADUPG1_012308 [Aduncisulcus paluster]
MDSSPVDLIPARIAYKAHQGDRFDPPVEHCDVSIIQPLLSESSGVYGEGHGEAHLHSFIRGFSELCFKSLHFSFGKSPISLHGIYICVSSSFSYPMKMTFRFHTPQSKIHECFYSIPEMKCAEWYYLDVGIDNIVYAEIVSVENQKGDSQCFLESILFVLAEKCYIQAKIEEEARSLRVKLSETVAQGNPSNPPVFRSDPSIISFFIPKDTAVLSFSYSDHHLDKFLVEGGNLFFESLDIHFHEPHTVGSVFMCARTGIWGPKEMDFIFKSVDGELFPCEFTILQLHDSKEFKGVCYWHLLRPCDEIAGIRMIECHVRCRSCWGGYNYGSMHSLLFTMGSDEAYKAELLWDQKEKKRTEKMRCAHVVDTQYVLSACRDLSIPPSSLPHIYSGILPSIPSSASSMARVDVSGFKGSFVDNPDPSDFPLLFSMSAQSSGVNLYTIDIPFHTPWCLSELLLCAHGSYVDFDGFHQNQPKDLDVTFITEEGHSKTIPFRFIEMSGLNWHSLHVGIKNVVKCTISCVSSWGGYNWCEIEKLRFIIDQDSNRIEVRRREMRNHWDEIEREMSSKYFDIWIHGDKSSKL